MPAGDPAALAADLAALATRLRVAADGELTRQLRDRIGAAVEPVTGQIRAGLPEHMPPRYAEAVASDLGLTVYRYLAPAQARVTLRGYNRGGRRRHLRQLNAGVLSHPLFGNRQHWYAQTDGVLPGFFDDATRTAGPRVREAVLSAVRDISDMIMGR